MKMLGWYSVFLLFSVIEVQVQAAETEAVVIEVRKNITLSKNDKITKNYFINGGIQLGLKQGTHVDVLRRLPVHDPILNASVGDLRVKVAELEIIHSEPKLSIAKLVAMADDEDHPVLDYDSVMVGDRLDLNSVKEAKKVALLAPANKAESLIKEGERHLATLSSLKTEKPAKAQKVISQKISTRSVASLSPSNSKKMVKRKFKKAPKKKSS